MSATPIRQTMFQTGEVDVTLWKRVDVDLYMSACQRLYNAEVGTTGLAKKRKGTKRLLQVNNWIDTNSQIYSFVDRNFNYYLIMSADTLFGWNVFSINATTGDLTYIQTISGTPYLSDELLDIDYAIEDDVLVLTHPNYQPARIYISDYGTSPPTFNWQYIPFTFVPAFDFNDVDYSQSAVTFVSTAPTFTLTMAVNPGFTIDPNSPWDGGQIIGLGNTAEQPIGYGYITSVTTGGGGNVVFTGNIAVAFAADASMPVIGSQYSIRKPSWSNTLGWPAKTLFFQNRLWFANTKSLPSTVFGSTINQPINFDVGVGGDINAIIYSVGQTDSGAINWLNGGKQLEIYCQNIELAAPQNENSGLTPSTFAIRQQTSFGASNNIKPVTYIHDSYFVSIAGNSIINYHFNGIGLTYVSSNISLVSQHLVLNPQNRALLRGSVDSQDNFIYFLNNDGTIASFQFAHEYKIAAITPVEMINTQWVDINGNPLTVPVLEPTPIKDIASVNNRIYMIKEYPINGLVTIESFDNFTAANGTIIKMDGWFEAVAHNGQVTGLDDYNDYVLQVVFNGQDYGQYYVSNGTLTMAPDLLADGDVILGILYDVNITPMYIFAGKEQSNAFKNLSAIFVDYYNSLDFNVNGTLVPFQTFTQIQTNIAPIPSTDTAIIYPTQGWNRYSTFSITQSSPFDLQVTAIEYDIGAKRV